MEDSNKLPLKRVELSLSKFNEVAIPHHLDLLRQHKANIIKYSNAGEYKAAVREQAGARRAASRLRALLAEMEALRARVRPADVPAFDDRTRRARDDTHAAVMDYLEWSSAAVVGSAVSTDSVGLVPEGDPEELPGDTGDTRAGAGDPPREEGGQLQLQVDEQDLALSSRLEVLRGWGALHAEVRALHEAWQHVQCAALQQRELVQHTAESTEVAAENVTAARWHLAAGERLREGGVWVAGGAVCGAVCGGPVGLAVGAKAGAAAALAGTLLGCLAARLLRRRVLATPVTTDDDAPHTPQPDRKND